MVQLESLPPSMKKRAEWARNEIINHPEKVEVDIDEMLAWVYSNEDERWYSIAGNYSGISPAIKMERRKKSLEEAEAYELECFTKYDDKYREIEYWSKIRQKVLSRDKSTCQICRGKSFSKLHIHHIMKKSEGGTDYYDNLITVCPKCHSQADHKLYNPDWKGGSYEQK